MIPAIDIPFSDIEDAVLGYAATVSEEFVVPELDYEPTSPHVTAEDVSAVVRCIGKDVTRPYPSAAFESALCGEAVR